MPGVPDDKTGSKRKRDRTFTDSEKMVLIDLIENHFDIVESKKTDAVSVRAKNEEWRKIEYEFNCASSIYRREWIVLKNCWENLKRRAKQKISKSQHSGPGEGPSKKHDDDPVIQRVNSLLQSGSSNSYDSDGNHNVTFDSGEMPEEVADTDNSGMQSHFSDNEQQSENTDREVQIEWSPYANMLRNTINPVSKRPSPPHEDRLMTSSLNATPSHRVRVSPPANYRRRRPVLRPVMRPERDGQIDLTQAKLSTLIAAKLSTLIEGKAQAEDQHQLQMNIMRLQEKSEEEKLKQEKLKTEQEQLKLEILKAQLQKLQD